MTSEDSWRDQFIETTRQRPYADDLRAAALSASLAQWTGLMTRAVVESCRAIGWQAAAKGHPLDLLPQVQQEYLVIDVMAFASSPEGKKAWAAPAAVFELENSMSDERAAYSLWKVSCVRAPLGVVITYRKNWEKAAELVSSLSGSMPEVAVDGGQTLCLLVGSHDKNESFPFGFFKFWKYVPMLRAFSKW
ncbi:MAG: hypothetical protein J0L78_06120 [Planctomycetes bacterium]|nr:hypothetical protein [Planctomycetota bacterium]